jgi:hypothetical protein
MKRTQGLITLAILHHVTIAAALIGLLWCCFSGEKSGTAIFVLELSAFAFLSVIVRRAWANIDGGASHLSPGKAQGLLWVPCFNFYWVFPAFVSLATQTNAKADAENVPQARIARGFGLVIATLFSVTTLTSLLAGRHAVFAWLHFLAFATYVGFGVTYIWQIRRSAEVFDERSGPALREPTKMPTVGVAGIIYGCAAVALLFSTAMDNVNYLQSPESLQSQIASKGYTIEVEREARLPRMMNERIMDGQTGISEIRYLKVYKDGQRVAGVYFVEGNFPPSVEKTIAERLGTRTLKTYNAIYFKAYIRPDREEMDVSEWLKAF